MARLPVLENPCVCVCVCVCERESVFPVWAWRADLMRKWESRTHEIESNAMSFRSISRVGQRLKLIG